MTDTVRRNTAYGFNNPSQALDPLPIIASRAPRTTDLNYPIGQIWINQPVDDAYMLTSVAAGAAHWEVLNAAAPGSAPISKYVVDADGTAGYTTIQAAINAAQAAGVRATVYVRPGTYTENLTFYDGIEVVGAINIVDSQNLTIIGMHTPPASGFISIGRAILRSATHIFNSNAAGSTTIYLFECTMSCVNGYTFNLPNWTGSLEVNDIGDTSTNNGFVNNSGGATIFTNNGQVGAGAANPMIANGNVRLDLTYVVPPIQITGAGNNSFNFVILGNGVSFGGTSANVMGMGSLSYGTITTANTATLELTDSTIITGAAAAITHGSGGVLNIANVTIDSSANPVIAGAGAGAVTIGSIDFLGSKNIAATLTTGFSSTVDRISPYTVGPTGTFATIQAALDSANAAGGNATVYVQPGTYVENLTLYDTVHITGLTFADAGGGTTITGVHIPPAAGGFVFRNLALNSATHIFNSAAAGTAHLVIGDCIINCTNGYTFNLPNWTGKLESWDVNGTVGTNDGYINNSGGAPIAIYSSSVGAGGANTMTLSGLIYMNGAEIVCSSNYVTGSVFNIDNCVFNRSITFSNNSTGYIATSHIDTGAAVAITMSSTADVWIKNTSIMTSNVTAIAGAGTGLLRFSGNEFIDSDALAATLAFSYEPSTRSSKLLCGDSVYRVTGEVTAEGNIIQAYGNTTGVTAGTTCRAFRGDLQIASGNSTESPQAVRGQITMIANGDTEEMYGGYFGATQNDGVTNINSNMIGCLGIVIENEATAADQPQQWITGSQSIVMFGAAAAAPTAAIVCANLNHVTYDAPMNALAHGVVVSRNGGGAGGTAAAAYKVVIGGGIVDWNYGLDLLNGGVGVLGLYGLADIRLANGTTIDSTTVTDVYVTMPANGRFDIQLGDAGGTEQFGIYSSTPALVAAIDSQGDITGNSLDVTLDVRGRELIADGDSGAGVGSTVQITNVIDEVLGAGAGTVLMKTGNPGNSSGWLKIYANGNVRYVPYWTNISP